MAVDSCLCCAVDSSSFQVCGEADIDLALLRSVAVYKGGFTPESDVVKWFWQALEEFTPAERSLFVRFAWGRSRLPRHKKDFKDKEFCVQRHDKYDDHGKSDKALPEAYTCFFLVKLPTYSSKAILVAKLSYAIHFCKSIDTDAYARTELEGVPDDPHADEDGDHVDDDDDDDDDDGSGSDNSDYW